MCNLINSEKRVHMHICSGCKTNNHYENGKANRIKTVSEEHKKSLQMQTFVLFESLRLDSYHFSVSFSVHQVV
jgi:hypothetical protein